MTSITLCCVWWLHKDTIKSHGRVQSILYIWRFNSVRRKICTLSSLGWNSEPSEWQCNGLVCGCVYLLLLCFAGQDVYKHFHSYSRFHNICCTFTRYLAFQVLISGRGNCLLKSTSHFFSTSQLESSDWWHDLPWSETFKRFLGIPPASTEDEQLLCSVLKLLRLYLNTCWSSERGEFNLLYPLFINSRCSQNFVLTCTKSVCTLIKSIRWDLLECLHVYI
jgi:hypothetical protein